MNINWVKFVLFMAGASLSEHWLPLLIMVVMAVHALEGVFLESNRGHYYE